MDNLNLSPNTEIVLRDANGNVKPLFNPNVIGKITGLKIPGITGSFKNSLLNHNIITNTGHKFANGRIGGVALGNGAFNVIGIGTGTTAAAATDTQLYSEITTGGGSRISATATQVTTSVTSDTTQLVASFTFSATFPVAEEGIFDSTTVSGSNILARQQFATINVNSGDSLTITHKYQS